MESNEVKLFCKACVKFGQQFKGTNDVFFKGWNGNEQGFKLENFDRHELKKHHQYALEQYTKAIGNCTNIVAPEVSTWSSKISSSLNEEVCNKFVCANLLSTEHISGEKFRPIITSYKKVGAKVGDTYRNLYGYNVLNAVMADKMLEDDTAALRHSRFFGLQGDSTRSYKHKDC